MEDEWVGYRTWPFAEGAKPICLNLFECWANSASADRVGTGKVYFILADFNFSGTT